MPKVVKSQVAHARGFLQPLPCEAQTLADIGKRSLTLPRSDPPAAVAEGLRGTISMAAVRRVGVWRGGFRLSMSVCRPFRLAVP